MDGTSALTAIIECANPKREWLVRCDDEDNRSGVCSVSVANGRLEIYDPQDQMMAFEGSQIADFRAALDDAIAQAELDLRARQKPVAAAGSAS